MAAVDLQPYKIFVGDLDYPTKHDQLLDAIEAAINPSWDGPWVTANAYNVFEIVKQGTTNYVCVEAHTSGVFATDLAGGKWEVYGGSPGITDGATVVVLTLTNGNLDIVGNITLSGTVDGIDIATDVAANTTKVSNANHTGEVAGSGALTVKKTAITNKDEVDPVAGDFTWISDASDSGNLKKVNVSKLGASADLVMAMNWGSC